MKKIYTFVITFFVVLMAINSNGQNFVKVSKSEAGQTINLSTDQVLEIKLPRKSSTGYTWYLSVNEDKTIQNSITQIGDDEFVLDSHGKLKGRKMVGGSGTQIIRYIGSSQGTTVLKLELRRPWEKENAALDSYTITVVSGGKYTGNYTPSVKKKSNNPINSKQTTLPSHWDWRAKCTPIADQQQCGDCWAFAGVGVFECNIKINDDSVRDISEEYLTNCDTANLGCMGGNCPLDYWLAPRGAVYENEDPWTTSEGGGTTGACGGPYVYHETIKSWAFVPGANTFSIASDESMKEAIYYYGPIWVGITAGNGWNTYTGGILTENDTVVDHAVVLVGWVDSAAVSGGGYWIVRNSWGASWGMNGYMYLSYGSDAVGTDAAYMVYKCRNNDFAMMAVTSPANGCAYTNNEYVSARIKYNGCNVIAAGDTLFTAYKADGGGVKNDTLILLNPVNSGDTIDFTFNAPADFSSLGTHTISCWVRYMNDTLPLNDSIKGYSFTNRFHQNIDVGVSAINSPISSCHLTNAEPVNIKVKFYGCDSLSAGNTIVLAYRINGGTPVKDTIQIPHTIMPGGTFNHLFTHTADLSAPGNYTFDAWTIYSVDTMNTNDMLSGHLVKSTTNTGYDTITFEEPDINSRLLVETTHYSHTFISTAAFHTGTKGFLMTGGNPMDYYYMIRIPDATDIWTINNFLSAKVNFCVDATGANWTGCNMRFDLRQTDGGPSYALLLGAGDYTKASSLRVLVNGVQIGGTFNPNTPAADPWVTHFINLDSMAGKQFTVTIETRNVSKDTMYLGAMRTLDNAYIDNVCFSPTSQQSIREYNTDISFSIYPNPFNEAFTVKYDADKKETVSVEIIDMLGRIINTRLWNVDLGSNRLDLNTGNVPAGMYMVKISTTKGFSVKNVVKQ